MGAVVFFSWLSQVCACFKNIFAGYHFNIR